MSAVEPWLVAVIIPIGCALYLFGASAITAYRTRRR